MNCQGHDPTMEYHRVNRYDNGWNMIETVGINLIMSAIIEASQCHKTELQSG